MKTKRFFYFTLKISGYNQISLKFIDNTNTIIVHLIFRNPFSSITRNLHMFSQKHSWMYDQSK